MTARVRRWLAGAEPAFSEARVGDAAALAALHAAAFQRGWSDAEFEQLLLDRGVVVDCATYGRELAGFIMSRYAADEAEILSVAVSSAWRRCGLAGRLLALHLRKLAGLRVQRVFLEVDEGNTAACRLYRRAGFGEVGRRVGYYSERAARGATALVLRRDLA